MQWYVDPVFKITEKMAVFALYASLRWRMYAHICIWMGVCGGIDVLDNLRSEIASGSDTDIKTMGIFLMNDLRAPDEPGF